MTCVVPDILIRVKAKVIDKIRFKKFGLILPQKYECLDRVSKFQELHHPTQTNNYLDANKE
jgi:hypothetical protein